MEEKRIVYETVLGRRCSDVHWWRVKGAMKACELPLDKPGFELFISLRKTSPKFYAQLHKVKKILDKKASDIGEGMTGGEIIHYLKKERISPHQSTVSRWFVKAGGYRVNGFYTRASVLPIIAMALIYQHKQATQITTTGDKDE